MRIRGANRKSKTRMPSMPNLEGLTPERFARAGGNIRVGADRICRVEADPIALLRSRGCLCREDRRLNVLLAEAAERYRADHYRAGLSGYATHAAFPSDFGRRSASPVTQSEAIAESLERFTRATALLRPDWKNGRPDLLTAVNNIVILEMAPEVVGCEISHRRSGKQGEAVAIDRLTMGLQILAVHYGLLCEHELQKRAA